MRLLIPKIFAGFFLATLLSLTLILSRASWEQIESVLQSIPYRCPLKLFTGLECAFCGMTHSWIALLKGDLIRAWHFNPFGPFVFLFAVVVSVGLVVIKPSMLERLSFQRKQKQQLALGGVAVLLIFTLFRNIFS